MGINTDTITPADQGTATARPSDKVEEVMEALRDEVIDPDLGINIVDLGFVYGVEVDEQNFARLTLTLTSPACPLTGVIEDQIRTALVGAGRVTGYDVEWVWQPAWTPERITEDGREQLHAIGFNL